MPPFVFHEKNKVILVKFCRQKRSIVYCVVIHEAQLTQKSLLKVGYVDFQKLVEVSWTDTNNKCITNQH